MIIALSLAFPKYFLSEESIEEGRNLFQIKAVGCLSFDFLIVGGGFAGSVIAERIASALDRKVLLIDRRNHIGGNAYDFHDRSGVLVHKYGPHIFHTNSARVWEYISGFTDWIQYEHRVVADVEGRIIPVPFNLASLHILFSEEEAAALERILFEHYNFGDNIPVLELIRSDVPEIRKLADYIYRTVYLGYTTKQWGMRPDELDPSVTARVPVRLSYDNRYFQDRYQAIPKNGYTELFRRVLDSRNITVMLNTEYTSIASEYEFRMTVYTGPVDEFFKYRHGKLPYRSLDFDFVHHTEDMIQPVAQINFPNGHRYTRITEFKHITSQLIGGTTVAVEYPQKHMRGKNEPYYPVPIQASGRTYEKYRREAAKLGERVIFVGRLAEYRYYNMDEMIGHALDVYSNVISPIFRRKNGMRAGSQLNP